MVVSIQEDAHGCTFDVHVKPRASRSKVLGEREGALDVALTSPPVEGAANAELVELLASALDVPRRAVTVVRGEKSRSKRVRVLGVPSAAVHALVERG